jgi:hypothetical protein
MRWLLQGFWASSEAAAMAWRSRGIEVNELSVIWRVTQALSQPYHVVRLNASKGLPIFVPEK